MTIQADLTLFFQPFQTELNDNDARVSLKNVSSDWLLNHTGPAQHFPFVRRAFGECFTSHSSSDTNRKGNERGKCFKDRMQS